MAVTSQQTAAESHFRNGFALYQSGQYVLALNHYKEAMRQLPDWYAPHWHAGGCCHQQRLYAEAISYYRQAILLNPRHATVRYHLAKALKDSGDLDAALPAYQEALALDPHNPEFIYSLGLLQLLRGDWLNGWAGYEYRFTGSDRAGNEHRPQTRLPRWDGQSVPLDSGIVIYAEQGMGDTIQCFRYARSLRKLFARVKFSVQLPLVSLFQANAAESIEIVPRVVEPICEDGYTHSIDLLSLPAVFRTTPATVPSAPYLSAPRERVEYWRQMFKTDGLLKVGVVWNGGKLTFAPARDMDFVFLQPLFSIPGVEWVSLQKDLPPPLGVPISDFSRGLCDFSDTAALIANLDLVLAVDTAVAHLAGAMGKQILLLNRYESEWRWMRNKSTTTWYPSMRIIQQPMPGDWTSVINEVSKVLSLNLTKSTV